MTRNPYAADPLDHDRLPEAPERTSALAIASAVCSLICCIPGLGLIGALLGVGAIISISGSNGRLRGRGWAIIGIVVGLLVSALWAAAGIGARQAADWYVNSMMPDSTAILVDLDAEDYTTARTRLAPSAEAAITDEDLRAFRAAYRAELGEFVSTPGTISELFELMKQLGDRMDNQRVAGQNAMPMVGTFEHGEAVIFVVLPPDWAPGGLGTTRIADMLIVTADGTEIRLTSPPTLPAPDAETPAPDADAPPEAGDEDTTDPGEG